MASYSSERLLETSGAYGSREGKRACATLTAGQEMTEVIARRVLKKHLS